MQETGPGALLRRRLHRVCVQKAIDAPPGSGRVATPLHRIMKLAASSMDLLDEFMTKTTLMERKHTAAQKWWVLTTVESAVLRAFLADPVHVSLFEKFIHRTNSVQSAVELVRATKNQLRLLVYIARMGHSEPYQVHENGLTKVCSFTLRFAHFVLSAAVPYGGTSHATPAHASPQAIPHVNAVRAGAACCMCVDVC